MTGTWAAIEPQFSKYTRVTPWLGLLTNGTDEDWCHTNYGRRVRADGAPSEPSTGGHRTRAAALACAELAARARNRGER